MFILDLYKWCESYAKFNRQHIAQFIYKHPECERIAKAANVSPRFLASSCSKEFCSRMMALGYLDGVRGEFWTKGSRSRPFQFDFNCFKGDKDRYTWEMMNVEKLSDEDIFK